MGGQTLPRRRPGGTLTPSEARDHEGVGPMKDLRDVTLFERCGRKERRRIASLSTHVVLEPGRELTTEGSRGREVVVILEGRAEVVRHGVPVDEVGSGDVVGELAVLGSAEERTRNATVRAVTRIEALVFTAAEFHTLCEDVPRVRDRICRRGVRRLAADLQAAPA